jgi:hypothetical protein
MLDFDGLLIDMEPFAGELSGDASVKWARFFAHTSEAFPVPAGVELVAALARIKWTYSISSTRPLYVHDRSEGAPEPRIQQRPLIKAWLKANIALRPNNIFMRYGATAGTTSVKREHFLNTATQPHPHPRPAVLFVDDEQHVVDELTATGVPALHISELAGLSDTDLESTLRYSITAAERLHNDHAQAQQQVPVTAAG